MEQKKSLARTIFLGALGICLALNCYFNFRPLSLIPSLMRVFDDSLLQRIQEFDRPFTEMPADQNAFVRFENFSAQDEVLAEQIYYRACYAAYPKKVFTAAPDKVLNRGRDILQSQFEPDETWLDRNHVGRVISCRRQAGQTRQTMIVRALP